MPLLIIGIFLSTNALALEVSVEVRKACRETTKLDVTYRVCLRLAAENESVSALKIYACNDSTKISDSFQYCLRKSANENITDKKISACGRATKIPDSFYVCLDKSEHLTAEAILKCGKETSIPEKFYSCLRSAGISESVSGQSGSRKEYK